MKFNSLSFSVELHDVVFRGFARVGITKTEDKGKQSQRTNDQQYLANSYL